MDDDQKNSSKSKIISLVVFVVFVICMIVFYLYYGKNKIAQLQPKPVLENKLVDLKEKEKEIIMNIADEKVPEEKKQEYADQLVVVREEITQTQTDIVAHENAQIIQEVISEPAPIPEPPKQELEPIHISEPVQVPSVTSESEIVSSPPVVSNPIPEPIPEPPKQELEPIHISEPVQVPSVTSEPEIVSSPPVVSNPIPETKQEPELTPLPIQESTPIVSNPISEPIQETKQEPELTPLPISESTPIVSEPTPVVSEPVTVEIPTSAGPAEVVVPPLTAEQIRANNAKLIQWEVGSVGISSGTSQTVIMDNSGKPIYIKLKLVVSEISANNFIHSGGFAKISGSSISQYAFCTDIGTRSSTDCIIMWNRAGTLLLRGVLSSVNYGQMSITWTVNNVPASVTGIAIHYVVLFGPEQISDLIQFKYETLQSSTTTPQIMSGFNFLPKYMENTLMHSSSDRQAVFSEGYIAKGPLTVDPQYTICQTSMSTIGSATTEKGVTSSSPKFFFLYNINDINTKYMGVPDLYNAYAANDGNIKISFTNEGSLKNNVLIRSFGSNESYEIKYMIGLLNSGITEIVCPFQPKLIEISLYNSMSGNQFMINGIIDFNNDSSLGKQFSMSSARRIGQETVNSFSLVEEGLCGTMKIGKVPTSDYVFKLRCNGYDSSTGKILFEWILSTNLFVPSFVYRIFG